MADQWGYLDYFFWGGMSIIAFAVLAGPLANLLEDVVVHGNDGGHGRRTREFHDAGRAAGLTYQQRCDELYINVVVACLRRTASDAVACSVDKTLWYDQIATAKQNAMERIASERPELLRSFQTRIQGLSYGHILYPTEATMVDRLYVADLQKAAPTEDQIAALRIVRSGWMP